MGCNCGSKGQQKFQWIWTPPGGGQSITYTSEVQARAKQIKSGGTFTKQAVA